jgi:hypothetical protein
LPTDDAGCTLSVAREVKKEIPATERSLAQGETIRRARTVTALSVRKYASEERHAVGSA